MDYSSLTYSAVGLPPGATFDPATRTFAWTPSENMAGNYSVTFRVSDGTLNDSKTIKITVNSLLKIPPTAQFTSNTRQGQNPLTVKFADQSVSAGSTSYKWDINNDGVTEYTTQNPECIYQTAGTYTVKLTVTNASGSDSEIKTNYITVSSTLSGIGTFGAESNPTGSPVGGGAGYLHIVTSGTYTVTTASQLIAAAASATNGQTIFIPSTASIDMTGQNTLVIKPGVTLASDRGYNGHTGALIYRKDLTPGGWENGMITAKSNSRITGLRIQGFQSVYGGDYGDWAQLTTGIGVTDQTGVEIDNNEIYYFSYNGVMLRHTSTTSNSNWVHHNYIHHVAARGEGYGIGVCRGTALIEANHFDYVRHAVSGVGYAGESYEARYNLHGTHNLDSNYDVHAADQAGSEWDGSTPSGRLYKIHHNTISSAVDGYESLYYVSPPTEGMYVYNNVLGRSITAAHGSARLYMTNNYIGGVLHASGQ
jgi:PKD repeat protein